MSFNPENFFLKRMGNCNFKIMYKNFTFKKSETIFGRSKDSDFMLKNMRCSLNHCKITFENGRIFIEDSSTAGTFVNNERICGRKVELFEGSIIGMGANPSRAEHVDKNDFYIYKVQKVEAPIKLDSSDEEKEEGNLQNLELNTSNQAAASTITSDKNNDDQIEILSDSDELENEENLEDLTQKIDEHLTASERLKKEALDSSPRPNQLEEEIPTTSKIETKIKTEPDLDISIVKLMNLRNIFKNIVKNHQQNPDQSTTSTPNKSTDFNPSLNNAVNLRDEDKYPSTSSRISAAVTTSAHSPADLQLGSRISSATATSAHSPVDLQLGPRQSTATATSAHSPVDLQPEWISTTFGRTSSSENFNLGSSNLMPEVTAPIENLPTQPLNVEQDFSDLPPEPPIFTPGPSNFQPIPLHLTESTSAKSSGQCQDNQQNQSIQVLNVAETPSFLPSPSHLAQTPSTITPTPAISGKKRSSLALRKKILPSTSSSSTSTPPLNYSPISSTSNLSSSALSAISSDKLQTYSRSSSTMSSASLPSSNSSTSDEQTKNLTPDQMKAKINYLRHYGQQCAELIDIQEKENSKLNTKQATEDLLDEVEGPKDTRPIYWKQGIAVVKTVRKPRKKRGRPKNNSINTKKAGETSENSECKKRSRTASSESKILKSKNSDITSQDEDKNSNNEDETLKTCNIVSEKGSTTLNSQNQSSNVSSPTKLKATARKTTNTGSIVTKRPFASIDDNKSKSEDSDSSNEYESAQSGNSESENEEERPKSPKRQKISTNVDESLGSKSRIEPIELVSEKQDANVHSSVSEDSEHESIHLADKPIKTYQSNKIKALIPTTSGSRKLEAFPVSDDENSKKSESETRSSPQIPSKLRCGGQKGKKIIQRRESITKSPNVQSYKLKKYLETHKFQTTIYKRVETDQDSGLQRTPKLQIYKQKFPQSPQKSSSNQNEPAGQQSGPIGRPSIHQMSPKQSSPVPNFHNKFPHLYEGLKESDSKSDSGSSSPTAHPESPPKSIPMKKRRQSVFEEQAQLIPENLTLNERSNAMRRWNQNTTKLIDIPAGDPQRRRKGRPKLNEDDKIKMLVEKSKPNEDRK